MRILHLTTFLQGGAGRAIASLAAAQRRAGHDVALVADASPEPGYETYPEYEALLASAGVPMVEVTSTFKRDVALNAEAARQVRTFAGRDVDVVHTHAATPALVARLAFASSRAMAYIHTMHGWGVAKTDAQVRADVALLSLADVVVTPSHAALDTLRRLGIAGVAMHVVPYGIDPDVPADPIEETDARLIAACRARGRRIALCVGTIGERKNQNALLEALATGTIPEVDAVFVGDGDVEGLRRRAVALGVELCAHVLGYRNRAGRYLEHADVLVLPSRNEGLPLVVLEACRAGVPVVASALPEIEEALGDRHVGFLAPVGDAPALARALREGLAAANDVAVRRRLRQLFDERHTLPGMIAAYERLYADLLAERHVDVPALAGR